MMTKPQKSALVQDLETKPINDDDRAPAMDSKLQTACIADAMANIRKIKAKDIQTFGDFCEQFLNYNIVNVEAKGSIYTLKTVTS